MNYAEAGGPAFPQYVINNSGAYVDGGMTLRDYFAAKATQGILAGKLPITMKTDADQLIAIVAYQIADSMLIARDE
jgi:hypothetical protein